MRPIVGQICSRCIYDESISAIRFDARGVCSYCLQIEALQAQYGTGTPAGEAEILLKLAEIRKRGQGRKYDCVVGVSGGTDSSFMLYWAVQNGLRPLAVHYDNTWNTAIATENIRRLLAVLKVDLYTIVVNNKEADDIFRSFFLADVSELDASTDLALAETLYRAAAKFGIKYALEGHSFVAEGISPVGQYYFDGRYIAAIHRRFGSLPMRTYPNMTFARFLYWTAVRRIQKIRPLWYIQYSKQSARQLLEREFGWQDYGGHHLENRLTAFFQSYYNPRKFGIDWRSNSLGASVRAGLLTREEALHAYYETEPYLEDGLLEYFQKRLNLGDAEFARVMARPPRHWSEYPTYKRRFERLRPLFYLLMKAQLVPHTFYLKYCFPTP